MSEDKQVERVSHASYDKPKSVKVDAHFVSGTSRQLTMENFTDDRIAEARAFIAACMKSPETFEVGGTILNPKYIEYIRVYTDSCL